MRTRKGGSAEERRDEEITQYLEGERKQRRKEYKIILLGRHMGTFELDEETLTVKRPTRMWKIDLHQDSAPNAQSR